MQENGSPVTILGHEIANSELKIGYTLGDEQLHQKYEPNSDGDVVVLADVSSDQTMQDEGLAREVVNRVQKLRKKVSQIDCFFKTLLKNVLNFVTFEFRAFCHKQLRTLMRKLENCL